MGKNVGGLDRVLRIIIGLGILSLYFFLSGNARWFALIGIVPLFTGLFSCCLLYSVVGINTCSVPKK
jgi:hypothetical protein